MALVSDELKACGIKVNTLVSGTPLCGSGVLYLTPTYLDYNYVLTAKHLFQESAATPFDISKVGDIEIQYSNKGTFCRLELIKRTKVKDKLITFDGDFAIIIIIKNQDLAFRQILVSDKLEDEDKRFFSWAIFAANKDELQKFNYERSDHESKRLTILNPNLKDVYLNGMSGAGVFLEERSLLYGIISRYPNEEFQNGTVDCATTSFEEINMQLKSLKRIELDTKDSKYKREVGSKVIDIHGAFVNGICLDLELARRRLATDIVDDWYHDPLKYIDLLNQNYLFDQLDDYLKGANFEAQEAERFYVPKKKFTLRLALISPFIDRIMYIATVGVLAEKLDKAMISNVYSARYNKHSENQLILNGVEQWKKMDYHLAEVAKRKGEDGNYMYGCIIEIDLLNFYDNISKKLLCEKILRVCETDNEIKAADLLYKILEKFTPTKEVGLPQNSDASSLLASFYLNQVDIFMQHHAPEYYRFMDDIRIFCKDKYEARKILQIFEFELRRCYLSVNSQKTEIYTLVDKDNEECETNDKKRKDFEVTFDVELNKIARLRASKNQLYLKEAFHGCIKLLKENLNSGEAESSPNDSAAKKVNYAFNTLSALAIKGFSLDVETGDFKDLVLKAVESIIDKPWITTEVCKILNLLPTEEFCNHYLPFLEKIVLSDKYNTYSFQTYQIWLLLAKHKCKLISLKKYAVEQIEKNDDTNRSVIAAMIVFMCSVDNGYRRVILRKFGEDFTHGYFENRVALISLRSFNINIIDISKVNKKLTKAPFYTNTFKNKDLVFVRGFDEGSSEENVEIEQLYSL